MKVLGFDGRDHDLSFKKHRYNSRRTKNKSSHHLKARDLLKELLPYEQIYEEVTLPGSRTQTTGILYADFFLPKMFLMVEVHGRQHYEFCSFFHKTKMDFIKSKRRDKKKIEWCELNELDMVVLPFDKDETWKTLINDMK
jgi:very-short-patch-repair endonuclease